MSIFRAHNIETMTEDDVSGELVRPLCWALGYEQGHPVANMRSQVSLQYDKAFLGHANSGRDPVLRGRPDFVCEVVSHCRWVIEAKAPNITLSIQDSYQAHTYATHPEIAAEFYVLTNGREFRLYRVGSPDEPKLKWLKDDTDDVLPALKNFLGPEAMKKRATVVVDLAKPLAPNIGIGSKVDIVGGYVVYTKNTANVPIPLDIDGLTNSVTGQYVRRNADGLIQASVDLVSSFSELDKLQRALGFYPLIFTTSEEYLSTDPARPSFLQNLKKFIFPKGTITPRTPMSPGGVMLFDLAVTCYSEAVGFIDREAFKGTFVVDYEYELDIPSGFPIPKSFEMRSEGVYEMRFV